MRDLTNKAVHDLGIANAELVTAMETTIRASRAGEISWRPKATIARPDGAFFLCSMAAWPRRHIAIFHMVAGLPSGHAVPGEPHYRSFQQVIDYRTGMPLVTVDGTFTANMLPAVMTALGARFLARRDSRIATFIGAGVQARVNLSTLAMDLPIEEVRILTRTIQTARDFADHVEQLNLTAQIVTSAEAAIRGADVIVSSVPSHPGLAPFLDPAWVSPGAFVSAVDVGRSWRDGFEHFDRIATDDRAQAVVQHAEGRMRYGGTFDSELSELIVGERPSRRSDSERAVLIHPGYVVGTLAITTAILERTDLMPNG